MSQAVKRPRREAADKPQVESSAGPSSEKNRRWKEQEMRDLLDCIMEHGHKNLDKAHERIPSRSVQAIKVFLRTAYDRGCRLSEEHPNIDRWIDVCTSKFLNEAAWKDSLQIARIIKYLSVDGLLEHHPLPERCQGVNFTEAYRLLYQALMGYPIQPVNEATSNFILDCMNEVRNELKIDSVAIEKMVEFLKGKLGNEQPEDKNAYTSLQKGVNKPLKIYERKKRKLSKTQENSPTLKIVVEANGSKDLESDYTKSFSLTVQGDPNGTPATVFSVPVPVPSKSYTQNSEIEEELLKSLSYNPFEFPKNWLEPVYLSLHQRH